MAVGKMLCRRNLLGYKHIQRPGSIEQNKKSFAKVFMGL